MNEYKECDGWFYGYDNMWTFIYNEKKEKITIFYRILNHLEVEIYKAGYETGQLKGQSEGMQMKSNQVKKVLGL